MPFPSPMMTQGPGYGGGAGPGSLAPYAGFGMGGDPLTAGGVGAPGTSFGGAAQTGASGTTQGPDLLSDPAGAVIRAMRQRGINPGSFHPAVRAILQHADDLVSTLLLRHGGDPNLGSMLANTGASLSALGDVISEAAHGGKVIGGFGKDAITSLLSQANFNPEGEGSLTSNLLASMLSDPKRALGLYSSGLYGGLTPTARGAMQRPLYNIIDQYAQNVEEQGTGAPASILNTLLGLGLQGPGGAQPEGAIHPATLLAAARAAQGNGQMPAPGYTPSPDVSTLIEQMMQRGGQ